MPEIASSSADTTAAIRASTRSRLAPALVAAALRRRARLAHLALAALAIRMTSSGGKGGIAVSSLTGPVITPDYQELNRQMHREREGYGVMARYHLPQVRLLERLVSRDILDYGCGKRLLEQGLGRSIRNYDPGIPGLDSPPQPADVVVCLDVMEHIEPLCLEAVLADLARVTQRAGYFAIATQPASKALPDGRNAHLIVEDGVWWEQTLSRSFRTWLRFDEPGHVVFLVQPRTR